MPPVVEIPPGVDLDRFTPLGESGRRQAGSTWASRRTGPWW